MRSMRVAAAGVVPVLAAFAAAGPGSAQSDRAASVGVTLDEMSISLSQAHVAPGKITFVAKNVGSIEHEFVVLRLAKGTPPVSHYKASEKGWVGEIDGVQPGKTRRTTMMLEPGRYEVICNFPGHYQLGMHTTLTVG
jgi:uncharacterized cupredoxin-like copper-binding protein